MIKMIWAEDQKHGIGKDGKMPWYLPEDYAHFKATTLGHPVIMGRTSWDALPPKFKPLPERDNYVITHHLNDKIGGQIYDEGGIPLDFKAALELAKTRGSSEDVFIIGGASIYEEFMPYADQLIISKINAAFDADTYAPEIPDCFTTVSRVEQNVSRTGLKWSVEILRRPL